MKKILLFLLIFISIGFSQYPESIKWWHLSQSVKDSINQISNNSVNTDKKPTWQLYEQFTKFTGGNVLQTSWAWNPEIDYYSGIYNRIYFTYYSTYTQNGIGELNYVFYYDLDDGEISDTTIALKAGLLATDNHGGAAIIVNDSGRVIIAADSVIVGSHNKGMIVRYSKSEDITIWNRANPSHLKDTDGSTNADGSYPNLFKLGNDTIFCLYRYGLSSTNHYRVMVNRSVDGGKTWDAGKILLSIYDATINYWAYPTTFMMGDSNKVGLIINGWNSTNSRYDNVYYLESYNGYKWYNVSHSFSKDISLSGEITSAEMNANFLVNSQTSDYAWQMYVGAFSPNGKPYLLGRRTNLTQDSTWFYFTYWNGLSFIKKDISSQVQISYDPDFVWASGLYVYDSTKIDIWIRNRDETISSTDSVRFQRWRTNDMGNNWYIVSDYPIGYDNKTFSKGGGAMAVSTLNKDYFIIYMLINNTTNKYDLRGFIYEKKY